ncbi:MAG: UDP-N-acetylmuramoyl-tripeptide--D-alanyl-D-alanine ligase, partial [Clostridiaceae bacterium]|nr:UDP-N-acetylmuramoyl-tripeptide--D-alanyl-D-alanine ligase [Clostridiaceae bacterium]
FGEIALLSSIVMPDIAVITNIGVSHIEKLGSKENILKAKLEVCENLNKDGYLILNGDDKLLWGLKGKLPFKTIYYGIENKECDYVADKPSNDSFILGTKNIILPVLGRHNIYNALCAIAVANLLDISTDEAVRGLMSFETDGIRQSIIKFGNITFMNDYYNASPPSMEAALDVLGEQTEHRRIAVLGGMLELGEYSKEAHLGVGKYASGDKCDILITVGGDSEYIKEGFIQGGGREAYSFSDNKSAAAFLKSLLKDGDFVLIKGSRGIKMEEIYKSVTE